MMKGATLQAMLALLRLALVIGGMMAFEYRGHSNTNHTDFRIEVANFYLNTNVADLHLVIVSGVPGYYTVLVDSEKFSTTNWIPYTSTNITADLGSVQGWHEVWVGLKVRPTSEPTWMWERFKYDTVSPVLFVTDPATNVVDVSMIQLRGNCLEGLETVSCQLSNSVGVVSDLDVSFSDYSFESASFHSLDIELATGLNVITIHATDWAGNVTITNFNFTLDYSGKTNPPTLQLTWPTNGTLICGEDFTLNGLLADPTATVSVVVTTTNGTKNELVGEVGRTGIFGVEQIPLAPGTNWLSVSVVDAVGNRTKTNLYVLQSPVKMTVDPLADPMQLWQPKVDILTGKISDPTYAVWVNGVKGTNNGDGTWSAKNVPVGKDGSGGFIVTGYSPDETQPDGSRGK